MFIKKLSMKCQCLYGLFSIVFAIILGVAAAFIRRFFSNLRKKYLKKTLTLYKLKIYYSIF